MPPQERAVAGYAVLDARGAEHGPEEGLRRRHDGLAQVRLERVDDAAVARAERLGRKRVIQRRFNVRVPRTRVPEKASTLRDRSER